MAHPPTQIKETFVSIEKIPTAPTHAEPHICGHMSIACCVEEIMLNGKYMWHSNM